MAVSRITPFNPAVDDVESWTSVLGNLLVASGIDRTKDDQKVRASATLLATVGVPTYTLIKDLVSPKNPETMEFDELVKVLKDHYKPAPKAISERYKFYNRRQLPTETVSQYMSELRRMAVTCKFKNLDISLRDQFVVGLSSEAAQKQLFLEDDSLKLEKALQIAISQETADASTKLIRGAQPPLNSIPAHKVQPKRVKGKSSGSGESSGSDQKCKDCGSPRHKVSDCPHKDIECFKCGGKGHFAKRCPSAGDDEGEKRHTLNHVLDDGDDPDPPVHIELKMNGKNVEMELDTGSGKTFIPPSVWKRIGSPELLPTRLQFVSYTGRSVELKGKAVVDVVYQGQCVKHSVFVTGSERGCLFGRDLLRMVQLDWSTIEGQFGQANSVVETGLGKVLEEYREPLDLPVGVVNNYMAKITLKDDATPKFCEARSVPYTICDQVNTVKTCHLCCSTRDDPAAAPLHPRRDGEAERTLLDLVMPDVSQTVRGNQEKQVEDFGKKETRQFTIGQAVWVRTFTKGSPTWSLGKILDGRGPLTYVVEAGGRRFKRQVDHLLDGEPVKPPTPAVEDRQEDDEIVLFPPEPPAEEHPSVFVAPNGPGG